MNLKYTFWLFCLFISSFTYADINNNQAPFSLTLTQVEQWSPTSQWADKNNVSTVALQARMVANLGHTKQPLDPNVKVLIAPDGMNNFANYLEQQNKFNLYNFTHWSHIDVLNWFAGTARETVSLPAKPWVETAHRNGVKVIGTVYLSVRQYGGSVETVTQLLQQNANGNFPLADKLIAMADFYGFDGWLINPETDLTLVTDDNGKIIQGQREYKNSAILAAKMQKFMVYLTAKAPEEMEIHWYDSTLLDGSVRWQNELNSKNSPYFQTTTPKNARVSDAMFINYWWNKDMVVNSNKYAKELGRSPYDIYFGADLSPVRNAQRIFERSEWFRAIFPKPYNKALSSIALFGNEVTYNFTGSEKIPALSHFKEDKREYRSSYENERRLFAGDDLNIFNHDSDSQWPGLARFVPAKTTLLKLPFSTSFNTGHGLIKAQEGHKVLQEWHDISQQDILPTWQFAINGSKYVNAFYDFEHVYQGGNSLRVESLKSDSLVETGISDIPLYQTKFVIENNEQLSITYQHNKPSSAFTLWLDISGKRVNIPLLFKDENWFTLTKSLKKYEGKTIERIGLSVADGNTQDVSLNIGLLDIK
jgi:endo-beta-N-acetylglucosaminidase D